MADDYAHPFAVIERPGQLDDAVERALERAHALQRRNQAVAYAQDGLDLQHRTEKRVGATDPSATAQELQGCHREVGLQLWPHGDDLGLDRFRLRASVGERRCDNRDESERHRHDLGVDDADSLWIRHVGRLARRRVGSAELLRDVDGDYRLVIFEKSLIGFREAARRRLRRGRVCGRAGKAAVELGRRDVNAVEQALTVQVERQGHDSHRPCSGQGGRQVRRRVGDDGNRSIAHLSSLCRSPARAQVAGRIHQGSEGFVGGTSRFLEHEVEVGPGGGQPGCQA